MGIRKSAAELISGVSSAALRHVFRRPAGNFPGKIALYVDPSIIAESAKKLRRGSICVVGTNGKTTVTNMVADTLVAAGSQVVCNRSGANLDSGVATSLLQASTADWGVFECDELWLVKILPHLQSRYVLLLNLFYDQLDRVGEVDYIQQSIISALEQSPRTVLIYNADDPHCEKIARAVSNEKVPFGSAEALDFMEGAAVAEQICQMCDSMLSYEYRTYSQLGAFSCPSCGFKRAYLKFMARNCKLGLDGMAFDIVAATDKEAVAGGVVAHMEAPFAGTYMIYNLLATYVAAHLVGASNDAIQLTVRSFNQHNGRLEQLDVHGRSVLLNLAKNPTGFNQNLGLVLQETGPVAVGFFVNDMEGDGHDVSWLWDVDFEALAHRENTAVFAGGMRAHDVAVRLKYAGVPSMVVHNATELMQWAASLPSEYKVFFIANYTSLPEVRAECLHMIESNEAPAASKSYTECIKALPSPECGGSPVRILQLYPDLLDQGGDTGNVRVLAKRCAWRGIPVEVHAVRYGEDPDFSSADIVVLGDGFDRQQRLACELLMAKKDELVSYVEAGGVLLAIDGGLQILGHTWFIDEEEYEGIGLFDMRNGRSGGKEERIVGDIVVQSPLAQHPIVGFENHAGITLLGENMETFGTVLKGIGNNEGDATEGVRYKNLIGTYVHGPVLGKNPEIADWLISSALQQKGDMRALESLDDSEELKANEFICSRLKIKA